MHGIIVNPGYKGQKQFQKILDWSVDDAIKRELKYIRMDTWANNPNLIEYYKSFGFEIVETFTTPDSEELPIQQRNNHIVLLQFEIKIEQNVR